MSALALEKVTWSNAPPNVGRVRAVADTGNVVTVLGEHGASVFIAGALAVSDAKKSDWLSASVVPGADGSARWIVGFDAGGRIQYLHNQSVFEEVSARYGLERDAVRGGVWIGGGLSAFLVDGQLALSDGHAVTRYATPHLAELSGASGVVVGVSTDAVESLRVADRTLTEFPLPGVEHAVVTQDGRLFASTPRALYAADSSGQLSLLYVADHDTIHGLVASGDRVWFVDAGELGVVVGDYVKETTGLALPSDASLGKSSTGDVWVLSGGGVARYRPRAVSADTQWGAEVAPVFARACSRCHLPDGISGTDLSTVSSWEAHRALIKDRVLDQKTMPPRGNSLSDADRAALAAWLTVPRPAN